MLLCNRAGPAIEEAGFLLGCACIRRLRRGKLFGNSNPSNQAESTSCMELLPCQGSMRWICEFRATSLVSEHQSGSQAGASPPGHRLSASAQRGHGSKKQNQWEPTEKKKNGESRKETGARSPESTLFTFYIQPPTAQQNYLPTLPTNSTRGEARRSLYYSIKL